MKTCYVLEKSFDGYETNRMKEHERVWDNMGVWTNPMNIVELMNKQAEFNSENRIVINATFTFDLYVRGRLIQFTSPKLSLTRRQIAKHMGAGGQCRFSYNNYSYVIRISNLNSDSVCI